jgi:hypothetical protein
VMEFRNGYVGSVAKKPIRVPKGAGAGIKHDVHDVCKCYWNSLTKEEKLALALKEYGVDLTKLSKI